MKPLRILGKAGPLLALLVLAGCIPRPEEPVEWVREPDAVIIQKKSVFAEKFPYDWYGEVDAACNLPEFTLYGDGTLIFREPAGEPIGLDFRSSPVFRTQLGPGEVEALLDRIVGEGFLDFAYQQPEPEPRELAVRYSSATTFLYVHTKDAANAVAAYALNTVGVPEGGGKEWDQYGKIGRVVDRLNQLSLSFGAGDLLTFEPAGELLVVQPLDGEPPEDPVPWEGTVSLARIASSGSSLVTLELREGDIVGGGGTGEGILGGHLVTDGGRVFFYCTRPLLPFEENFPEFEAP